MPTALRAAAPQPDLSLRLEHASGSGLGEGRGVIAWSSVSPQQEALAFPHPGWGCDGRFAARKGATRAAVYPEGRGDGCCVPQARRVVHRTDSDSGDALLGLW